MEEIYQVYLIQRKHVVIIHEDYWRQGQVGGSQDE
jgi:hypothetical protein